MKVDLSCSIVQDLLPNYIEKLTNDETNKAILEHLNSCDECHEIFTHMSTDIGDTKKIPIKELQFLKKIKKTKIIAALLCIILTLTFSYMIYASEYKYTNDKGVLSTAITEYTSNGQHAVDAYVLETKQIDGNLMVFFKDSSDPDVYGFAKLSKGLNRRYRLINAKFGPSDYSSVVRIYEFETGKGTYYAICGHNIDSKIKEYGLRSFIGSYYHQEKSFLQKINVSNTQFLDLYKKSNIMSELGVEEAEANNFSTDIVSVSLLNSAGNDVTEDYRKTDDINRGWGAGVGTAELFVLNVMVAIVLILGIIFTRYFLTD